MIEYTCIRRSSPSSSTSFVYHGFLSETQIHHGSIQLHKLYFPSSWSLKEVYQSAVIGTIVQLIETIQLFIRKEVPCTSSSFSKKLCSGQEPFAFQMWKELPENGNNIRWAKEENIIRKWYKSPQSKERCGFKPDRLHCWAALEFWGADQLLNMLSHMCLCSFNNVKCCI